MVHGYVLRTAFRSLASRERDLAEEEIEEIDVGDHSPNPQHRHSRRRAPPPPSSPPVAVAAAGAAPPPPPLAEVAAVGEGGLASHEVADMAAGSGPRQSERAGEPCRGDVHRRLEFSTPKGALYVAEALLRHPPVTPGEGSNAKRWFDDMAKLVNTAQRQLAADLASSSHRPRGSYTAVTSSSRRRARRAVAAVRAEEAPPAAAQAEASRDPLYAERDARVRIEQLPGERRAGRAPNCAFSSGGAKAR
uniref:Uncharacterized protein n=1 Tax=Leersia perrieri TaxID=77586 RepID=A0A0D9WZS3_9ORYZ